VANMNTLLTIQNMMVEQFELKEEDVTPDAQLETLGLDSLSIIEFMFNLEDKFHIKLSDERVEIKTVRDVATIVERLLAEQKTSP
jgi:acyl carrier protein